MSEHSGLKKTFSFTLTVYAQHQGALLAVEMLFDRSLRLSKERSRKKSLDIRIDGPKKQNQKKKRHKREEMRRIKRIPNKLLSVFIFSALTSCTALEKKGHHHLDGSARTEDRSQTDRPTDPTPIYISVFQASDVYTVDGISIIKMLVNACYKDVRCRFIATRFASPNEPTTSAMRNTSQCHPSSERER